MEKLKTSVYKKLAFGATNVSFENSSDLLIHPFMNVPESVLSGCKMLNFKKTNFLAVVGALETYGLLLLQLNREKKFDEFNLLSGAMC